MLCIKEQWVATANFTVQQLPGCCAIMTLSYVRYARQVASFEKVTKWVEQAGTASSFGLLMAHPSSKSGTSQEKGLHSRRMVPATG